jgi:uncharacterized protein
MFFGHCFTQNEPAGILFLLTLVFINIPDMKSTKHIILFYALVFLWVSCRHSNGKKENHSQSQVITSEIKQYVKMASLHEAASNGNINIVIDLLQKGAEVDKADGDGRTALMYAAYNGHSQVVRELLAHNARVNMTDVAGRTALMFAASGPFPETVKLLLDHKADPNITDLQEHFTALMFAACEGQQENVKLLLAARADPDLKDIDGDNASGFAVKFGHTEIAEMIRAQKR